MTPRPGTVTAARRLLPAVGVLPLLSALLGVALLDEVRAGYIAAYGGMRGGDEATGAVIAGVLAGVVILAGYAVSALLLGRPRTWVRIGVWVLCAAGGCCLAPGVLGGSSVTSPRGLSPGASSSEITARIAETAPGWYVPATIGLAAASVLGVVTVGVLLALPAASAYYRKADYGTAVKNS